MKKKILCFILVMLMIFGALPLSVFAEAITETEEENAGTEEENTSPVVSVSSLYSYKETNLSELRALPDAEGKFSLEISLDKMPQVDSDILVYYRTVDDSAVAKWGDYEDVGIGAYVTLNKLNGYKARVTVESKILDDGFYTTDEKGEPDKDKLVTRRFLFELTSVVGDVSLNRDKSELYCYLRSKLYHYQQNDATVYSPIKSLIKNRVNDYFEQLKKCYSPDSSTYQLLQTYIDSYLQSFESKIKYYSLYHSVNGASAINTPKIQYKGTHKDNINLKFDEEWQGYVQSGWCDLGISIQGDLISEYWDSDGPATFHLYYYYGGEKKLALSLYLQGEFDDSTHFGWEHAFEYANEGREDGNRDDHMDENFIGFTVYGNNGKEAYKVKIKSRSELDEIEVCSQLKKTIIDGNAVLQTSDDVLRLNAGTNIIYVNILDYIADHYYLRLPSNFALADSYSYEFITESTRDDDDEIRWLENVNLYFTLIGNRAPMIAKDETGNQLVTTNLDTIKTGDPLRMSVRFDRPVYIADPNGLCYITADIYNDKGARIAKGVKLTLSQLDGNLASGKYFHYAWDTLVFEGDLPEELEGARIASIRNVKLMDGKKNEIDPTHVIKSFFTNLELVSGSIQDIYISRDFTAPVATIKSFSNDNWSKTKSVDVYVNSENGGRFNDYVTVYYQWSNSASLPETYSSRIVFHTKADGEVLKTIIGNGSGQMYLHLKTVSYFGKESISDARTVCYDPKDEEAVYTPFGPFKFDNDAPSINADQITVSGSMTDKTISVPLPDDGGGVGLGEISLYYLNKNGEQVLLEKFAADAFTGDPKTLNHTISHADVGIGVDADGNVVLARGEVEFYWVLTDILGNSSGKTAEFSLVFDTNDYLDAEIKSVGIGHENYEEGTTELDEINFIYNHKLPNAQINLKDEFETDKDVYYAFLFEMAENAFGASDDGEYSANVYFKGERFTDFTVVSPSATTHFVLIHSKMRSGRYDIQLVRTEDGVERISEICSVYATNDQKDDTEIKQKVEFGTLLSNTVFQLSADYPYFYYKDINGIVRNDYYNDTRQPPTFSSLEKAKEYVYYKELGDIYLVELNAATAGALISGTTGYLIARGETVTPAAGQYWIRYKSDTWTPTSGESAWVYYYYGMSDELTEGSLSANIKVALNSVANRIVSYGKTIILTDTSLFLGSSMNEKMLDKYGMPYLAPGQLHITDELSRTTMCGNAWSVDVGFAADKNIYKSKVYVGVEGDEEYMECPIVGNFALPEDSIFQYMTYDQYKSGKSSWKTLNIKKGESFINVFAASGVYYIREIAKDGVSIYAIYVDKEAPKATFFNTDENGNLKEIPVDGKEILNIRTKDLYLGSFAPGEYDTLSYVAVYKVSNLSLVGVYTADMLKLSSVRLDDGNYYIVVSDRSGNRYTITAKVSSTDLECSVKESADRFIRLTCNRRTDQIQRYEVYLNGELVTSTYLEEQSFTKAGLYTIYVLDIYGNEYYQEHLFERNYPTVTWKYYGTDGKYHTYVPDQTATNGFILTWISDNQYKVSTAVKTRFSFNSDYAYEFIGAVPKYTETIESETTVTIEEGQSFTLKVYYKNHKDCYSIYSGVVDVTPPSVNVSAEVDVLQNGEYSLFEDWAQKGNEGDVISFDDLYYVLSEINYVNVANGGTVTSDFININANDANGLSFIEVYLDGELIEKRDAKSGYSQIVVNRWGSYRIVAKDGLGNLTEYVFTNGEPDYFDYYIDGSEYEKELHGYLNFEEIGGKQVYTKIDYGRSDFELLIKQNANLFISVGVSGGATEIYGFDISDGCIYPLTYKIVLDKNNKKTVEIDVGKAILDVNTTEFRIGVDYLLNKDGSYAVYASVDDDKNVRIKARASDDPTKVVSIGARVEVSGSNTMFVQAELSKKSSEISFDGLGAQTNTDIHLNSGFSVDESTFESERITGIQLYYSKVNDLVAGNPSGKTNIYSADREYGDEGFYLLIVKNRYGNERTYRISISKSFGITSSVTFGDGLKFYYSMDYNGKLYSDSEIVLDILDEGVTTAVSLNGVPYTGFLQKKDDGITYLVFSDEGSYEVILTDSYGNVITRHLEINKSDYTITDGLLTGYNEKALKRDEGYTNQMLSVDKTVYDSMGIYYLAIQYGENIKVLFDAFAESPVVTADEDLINVVGADGDGVYKVICRNRYGAVVTTDIHYRGTPTLKLERTTRSILESEVYDLSYALSLGFWSNNTLIFSTDAKTYAFTINGSVSECPRTLVFENAGDYGSFEYAITYVDEYGFEYSFNAYLVRKSVEVDIPSYLETVEIDGLLSTTKDISINFGENVYATYTRDNGEEVIYHSGEYLKKDGIYRFTVIDYAGNATLLTIKKDTAVEFAIVDSLNGSYIHTGAVVNSSKIVFKDLNKDGAYIESVIYNGVTQSDFSDYKFSEDGKWELVVCDKLGNKGYFNFYVVTHAQNGFAYTTPYEYHITEMWYDSGDGVNVSYMTFVNHTDSTSSFNFTENGKYRVVMVSDVTGMSSTFEFTVNTNAPAVSLVGCNNGETTINDVTLTGHKVGDRIRIYRITKTGEEIVDDVEITSLSTKPPVITEGGKYRIVVESEAGVQTEFSLVRKHVMNTAGSIFIMVVIGLSVVGLFTGLVYRNKSKTDD